MKSSIRVALFIVSFWALIALACVLNGCATVPKAAKFTPSMSDHQPPRFLPGIALYDHDGRFVAFEVGKTFGYSCKEALDDTQATLEHATTLSNHRAVGLCVPIPTYNAADLVPGAEPAKPDTTL